MQIKICLSKPVTFFYSLVICALIPFSASATNEVDAGLVLAFEQIWQGQAPATSLLSSSFSLRHQRDTLVHEPDVRNGISYISQGAAGAQIEFQRRTFKASDSQWGGLPLLDTARAQLTQIDIPRKNYLILSAPGTDLFSIADWSRFSFLHVLDVTRRNQPVHYPLVAEAHLGIRVLGRLPGSASLNYARLVPSQWYAGQNPSAYEVTLYSLEPRGPQKVLKNGKPLTFLLTRRGTAWSLESTSATPVTDERDALSRPFTSRPASFTTATVSTVTQQGQ